MNDLTTQIHDPEVQLQHSPDTLVVNIVEQDATIEVLQSGDSATVNILEETIALVIGGQSSSDSDDLQTLLGGLGNVSEAGRLDGSVLAFDLVDERWKPTNMQRGQIYDGGNF